MWRAEKADRLQTMAELQKIEQALCDIMHSTPLYIPSQSVPSQDQIKQLRQHTESLASEKVSLHTALYLILSVIHRAYHARNMAMWNMNIKHAVYQPNSTQFVLVYSQDTSIRNM